MTLTEERHRQTLIQEYNKQVAAVRFLQSEAMKAKNQYEDAVERKVRLEQVLIALNINPGPQ